MEATEHLDLGVRLAAGEDRALDECYAALGPSVLSYLRRYVGPDEAEDVLQRTFLDVWRHADRYDPRQSFTGWLFTIAHRRAVDSLRSRRPAAVPVEAVLAAVPDDGSPDVSGQVTIATPGPRTEMNIRTAGLRTTDGRHFYYAWLLDPATNKMLPLGVVPNGETHLAVDSALVRRYSALDVILQSDDGDPRNSATSVLRATY